MDGSSRPPRPRHPLDAGFWILAVVAAVWAAAMSRWLVYPDLNLDYPFPGGDGLDWLSNGLALGGAPVRYSGRAPLLPLLIAGLDRLGALAWFPVLQQAFLGGLALAVYALARARFSAPIAAVLGAGALASQFAQGIALAIGADLAAVALLTAAAAAWVWSAEAERGGAWRIASGALAGASAVTQPAVALALVPAAAATLVGGEAAARRRRAPLIAALLLAIAPLAAWELLGPAGSGREGLVGARQSALFDLGSGGLSFYGRAASSQLGLTGLTLAALGLLLAVRALRRDAVARLALVLGLLLAGFFLVYRWRDARFLLFLWPAGALLTGFALEELLRSRWVGAVAAAFLVLGLAWPVAGTGWSDLPVARARQAWRERPAGQPPVVFTPAGDRSAVFLLAPGATIEDRYRDQTRLGNALRLRVKPVPADLYPAGWWGWSLLEPLPPLRDVALYRWRWRDSSWIVATRQPSAIAPQRAAAPGGADSDWRLASELAAGAPGPDGLLAVLADPATDGEWLRLVPFAASTSSLFVVTGAAEQSELLGALRREGGSRRLGGVERWRSRFSGWPVEVVLSAAVAGRGEALR